MEKQFSAFFAPEIQCDSLNVAFNNQSLGANDYLWFFEDPDNPGATSMEQNPLYNFPDTGRFDITLIAQPGTICADTSTQSVYLQPNSLQPDFSIDILECTDSLIVQFRDLSMDSLFDITNWFWTVSPGELDSNEQNPQFSLGDSGQYTIALEVQTENGCTKRIDRPLEVSLIEEELPADTLIICFGDSVALNPTFNGRYSYLWDLGNGERTSNPNPIVAPITTTVYQLTVTDTTNFCQEEKTITVFVPERILLAAPVDTISCEPEILLVANSNVSVNFSWSEYPDFREVFSEKDSTLVIPFGEEVYFVRAVDEFACSVEDSVQITGNGVNIAFTTPLPSCQGDSILLSVENLDPTDTLSYNWLPANLILGGQNTNQPRVLLKEGGPNIFVVNVENQLGCNLLDSIAVPVIDTSNQIQFISEQQCSGLAVDFSSTSVNAEYYVWDFGDPNDPSAIGLGSSVRHLYSALGTYEIEVSLIPEIGCPDTLRKSIVVTQPEIILDFDWDFSTCSDTANVIFQDLSINNQSTFIEREWVFGNGQTSTIANPLISIDSSLNLLVTLIQTSSDGCIDSITRLLNLDLIEVQLPDTLIICNGQPVALNPEADTSLRHMWTPIEGLDDPSAPNPKANPSNSTNYSVTISNQDSICSIQREVQVIVSPEIEYTLSRDTTICSLQFTLSGDSPQEVCYSWSNSNSFDQILGMDPELIVFPEKENTYYLELKDTLGCTKIDSVILIGNGIQIIPDNAQTICVGDTLQLNIVNLTTDELFYDWSPKVSIIIGDDQPNPVVSPETSTLYEVIITNEFGCILDTSVQVNIFNFVPPLEILAEPDTLVNGGEVQLFATEEERYVYLWEQAALLDAIDIFNPVATIEETTTFSLTIRDQNGCINQEFIVITVVDPDCIEPFVFIPNGFTPNDDGLNDRLEVKGNYIEEMHLIIYNRWGEKVFESRSQNEGWDGTFKGKKIATGCFCLLSGVEMYWWTRIYQKREYHFNKIIRAISVRR